MPAPAKKQTAPAAPARRVLSKETIRAIFRDAAENVVADLEDGDGSTTGEEVGGTGNMPGGSSGSSMPVIHVHLGGQAGMPTPANSNDTMTQDNPDQPGVPAAGGDIESRLNALEAGHTEILKQLGTIAQAVQAKTPPAAPAAAAGTADEEGDEDEPTMDEDGGLEHADLGTSGNSATGPHSQPNPGNAVAGSTKDSAALEGSWRELIATAEILLPGLRLPTFDAAAKRKTTIDSMCQLRRRVLDHLNMTADGAALVRNAANGGQTDTLKMSCGEVGALFKAAGAAKRVLNNANMTRDASSVPGMTAQRADIPNSNGLTVPKTPADLNRLYRDLYKVNQ